MSHADPSPSRLAALSACLRRNPLTGLTLSVLLLLLVLVWLPWPFDAVAVDPEGRLIELVEGTRDHEITALRVGASVIWAGTRTAGLLAVTGSAVSTEDRGLREVPATVADLVLTDLHLWGAAGEAGLFVVTGGTLQRPPVPFGLTGLAVTRLALGADRVWIGTTQGLLSYNLSTWSTYLMRGRSVPPAVTALLERQGLLWVGTDEGLYTFGGEWNAVPLAAGSQPAVRALADGGEAGVLCGSDGGLVRVAGDGTVTLAAGVDTPVRALVMRGETVWAGGPSGLFRGTVDGPFTRVPGLPYDRVTALAVDDAHLWVGTERGLFRYQLVPSRPAPTGGETSGGGPLDVWVAAGAASEGFRLPASVGSRQAFIVKADEGRRRLWVGTEAGAFLFGLDGRQLARFTKDNGLPDDKVHVVDVEPGEGGRTWFGTMGGLAVLDGERWTSWRPAEGGLADANVWALKPTRDGVWVGSDGGVQFLDREGRWTTWTVRSSPLVENWIQAIAVDSKGDAWVGVWNGGVARFGAGTWQVWTDPDGLPDVDAARDDGPLSDAVTSLTVDGRDNVWVGTTAGLCRFDGRRWYDYDHPDWGIVAPPLNYLEMAPDGETLAVAGRTGVTLLRGTAWRTYLPLTGAAPSVLVREGDARTGLRREYFLDAALPTAQVWSVGFLGNAMVMGFVRGTAALVF